ncbi:hypothetical protein RIL96_04995 [Nesterenkonia sp. LY-0111]|uniref:ATP-grasp domain-containing protein n=1 Tax=Nesterenkonia aerolata TaxID=3074079 RepID=A0ABU2DQY7_9MICC|nr:hypothetical protein [Nesterenkonia sp. LY-0111]
MLDGGTATDHLRSVAREYQNCLLVLLQSPALPRLSASRAVAAGAGLVISQVDAEQTTVDFHRRRVLIRLGGETRAGDVLNGGRTSWDGTGTSAPADEVWLHRIGNRLEIRIRLAAADPDSYERALRLSSDPESFLDNVVMRTDEHGTYFSLRLRPTGRVPLRRASQRDVSVSWDGEESTFDFDPHHGINSLILRHELQRRGIASEWTSANSFVTEHAGGELSFHVTSSPRTAQTAAMVTDDKDVTRTVLQSAGISVARGQQFNVEQDINEGLDFFRNLSSVVVKPVRGTKGRGVTVDIDTEDGFREAWTHAFNSGSGGVLVEEHFRGTEVRFLVVGGTCIAAALRLPPYVTGDGQSTLRELVSEKNRQRRTNPHLANRPIVFDSARLNRLKKSGLTLQSVLEDGQDYIIDYKGGFSTGADSKDVTDLVHPSYLEVAAGAAAAIPGLPVSGVDILLQDFEQPASPQNHIILELNSQPGIGGHHFPVHGEPRNVGGALVDLVMAERTDTRPERPIPHELSRDIPTEDREPDASRMAEEFEALGFDVIWLNRSYFVAQRGGLQTTIWGTYTHFTGKNALVTTRSPRNAEVMLTRRGVPQLRKAVFLADSSPQSFTRGTEALAFAQGLGDVSLRCQTLEPHLIPAGDEKRFRDTWRRLSREHGSIVVEQRPAGQSLRVLVAYGEVLGVVLRKGRGYQDITDDLAEGYAETAVRAAAAFPGLDVCEVQMIVRDPLTATQGDDHWVGIVRAKPTLALFEHPGEGAPRNLAGEIVRRHIEVLSADHFAADDAEDIGTAELRSQDFSAAEITVERAHAVEFDATDSDIPGEGPTFLVRLHGRTPLGEEVIGEGMGATDSPGDREQQRQAWRALTQAIRRLRRDVRTLHAGRDVETQLRHLLPDGPESAAVRKALISSAADLCRHDREDDGLRVSQYPKVLHKIRRRVWSPRLSPPQTPNGLSVNDHDAQIDLAGSSLSYSSFLLQQEALRRGMGTVRYTRGDFVAWDQQGAELTFWRSLADTESPVSEFLCDHKQLTRSLLLAAGVPTAQGRVFDQAGVEAAVEYAESLQYPVVVKPQKGRKGRGVVTDISDAQELREAISSLTVGSQHDAPFIVERHLKGQDYRIYVAFGEAVSVVLRRPASVIGDGTRSVAELVAAKNALRLQSTHTRTRLMKADRSAERMLQRQELSWSSVPTAGREVVLASAANISQGGDSIEVIDQTHPSLLQAAVGAVKAIPGLHQAGVDFLMQDHTQPVEGQGGGVCEINALASLMASQAPFVGPTQPVAARVVERAADERGMELMPPVDDLCVRVRCDGVPDARTAARWLSRQARRLGLRGHMISGVETAAEGDAQVPIAAVVAGPAPVVMRLISGTTVGPIRRRPSMVMVVPTNEPVTAEFQEMR